MDLNSCVCTRASVSLASTSPNSFPRLSQSVCNDSAVPSSLARGSPSSHTVEREWAWSKQVAQTGARLLYSVFSACNQRQKQKITIKKLPYSTKFSRRYIFGFFKDQPPTSKIKHMKIFIQICRLGMTFTASEKIVCEKYFQLKILTF